MVTTQGHEDFEVDVWTMLIYQSSGIFITFLWPRFSQSKQDAAKLNKLQILQINAYVATFFFLWDQSFQHVFFWDIGYTFKETSIFLISYSIFPYHTWLSLTKTMFIPGCLLCVLMGNSVPRFRLLCYSLLGTGFI